MVPPPPPPALETSRETVVRAISPYRTSGDSAVVEKLKKNIFLFFTLYILFAF